MTDYSFIAFVDQVYGLYLDATLGFHLNLEHVTRQQNDYMNKATQQQKPVSLEQLDKGIWRYKFTIEPDYE